jgi:alpha-D-ribose 1-methylphosphonate 5-triphosphate synthase subunit PhnG
MNRKMRTEIFIKGSKDILKDLSEQILKKYKLKVIKEPQNALVMVKMRETAQKSLFYLGEVFVTECKVSINDCLGTGIVKGHEPELSYRLAVIDAAYNACLAETIEWENTLEVQRHKLELKKAEESLKVLKTKVSFETMNIDT